MKHRSSTDSSKFLSAPVSTCTNLWLIALLLTFLEREISGAQLKNLDAFQAAAAQANRVLTIPNWEQTTDALTASIIEAIAKDNAALDQIGSQNLEYVTFESSVAALDNLRDDVSAVANRTADQPRTITAKSFRSRSSFPRTRSCAPFHCDPRELCALRRDPCPSRFRRGAVANVAKLDLG
jgi:hypothetical protein